MIKPRQSIAAAVALLLLLTACSSAAGDPPVTDTPSTTEAPATTEPPMTGESVTITGEAPPQYTYAQTYEDYHAVILRQAVTLSAFGEFGETLARAEADRDAALEQALAVTLERETALDMSEESIRRIAAGEAPDLLEFAAAAEAATLAPGGYLADLTSLPLDLAHVAYDDVLIRALTVAGHTYFLFGAATVADKATTAVLLLDRNAADAVALPVDIMLDQIKAGKWSAEMLLNYTQQAAISLDRGAAVPLFLGSGGKIFDHDAAGKPVLTTGDTFSRAYAAMQQVMTASTFSPAEAVFTLGTLDDLTDGVIALPLPTAETGAPYLAPVDPDAAACVVVPASPENPTRTADLLNAYFVESVEPIADPLNAYLVKFTDVEILDAILGARTCALGTLFGWGDLAEALTESIGIPEEQFLAASAVRMTAAARAMDIFVDRLK